jgi:hypothetical protein
VAPRVPSARAADPRATHFARRSILKKVAAGIGPAPIGSLVGWIRARTGLERSSRHRCSAGH